MYLNDGGDLLRIDKKVEDGWVVRHVNTNEVKTAKDHEIFEAIHKGKIHLAESDSGKSEAIKRGAGPTARVASDASMRVFLAKKQWIEALRAVGYDKLVDSVWIRGEMDRLAKTTLADVPRYSISTLAKMMAVVQKAGGDWSKAIPQFADRGGKGKTRTDPRAEKIIQSVLDREKSKRGRFVRTDILDEVRALVQEENKALPEDPIQVPGDSTIDRRIAEKFGKFEIMVRNSGSKVANSQYRENSYPRDRAQYPLEISEYDDLDCGIFLVNDKTGLPVGRAFLTHGVCQSTSVPLGFDLSHKARSYESALGAICCSLLPKDPDNREFGERAAKWIGYGAQGSILLDGARYNHSTPAVTAAEIGRLALAAVRPYGPTEKCSIEHYNWVTEMKFCSRLPGWKSDKRNSDSIKRAMSDSCLDVNTFRKRYVHWVVNDYLNDPGEDGYTPKQRWQLHYQHHGPAVRWTRKEVALIRLRPIELTYRASGGIKRLGLIYNSEALMSLRREIGHSAKVLVFVDNEDMSYVLVRHPRTHQMIQAEYVGDPRYVAALTAHQQGLTLKMARERGKRSPTYLDMVQAREDLAKLVSQARRSKKLRERLWAERVGEMTVKASASEDVVFEDVLTTTETVKVERVMTDLEWSIVQLEQIEIEATDEDWQ